MKKLAIILVLIFNSLVLFAQGNIISFDNYRFRVNNNLFFPIGWYGGSHTDLKRMKKNGANVVLQYWANVIKDYWKDYLVHHSERWGEKDCNLYRKYLKEYLDAANLAGIKVIVELPTENVPLDNDEKNHHLMSNSFISKVVGDDSIRFHPALLGWYQADEPEGLRKTVKITQAFLVSRYKLIKSLDSDHPVFVVFADPKALTKSFPISRGRIFDVAMLDIYPMRSNEKTPYQNYWWTRDFYRIFKNEFYSSTSPDSGSTIIVEQGYGYNNPINSDFRDPELSEIYYHAFTPIYWAQDSSYNNLGGLMFWDYDDANSNCREIIDSFMQCFSQNDFGKIILQDNLYKYVGTTDFSYWPIRTFKRFYNKSYYLFTFNDNTVSLTNYSIIIKGIGDNIHCINLSKSGINIESHISSLGTGNQLLIDSWQPLEVRIYKITP